jgi:hypothetical protein
METDLVSEMFTVWSTSVMDEVQKPSNQSYSVYILTSELHIYSKTSITSADNADVVTHFIIL